MQNVPASPTLVVYGHDYCPQAWLLKRELLKYKVEYEWRDIASGDTQYQDELKALARGYLSVPTVVFADGTVMVEPGPHQVLKKLGVLEERKKSFLSALFGLE